MKTPKYTVLTRPDVYSSWLVAFAGNGRTKAELVLTRETKRGRDAFIAIRADKSEGAA